VLFEVGGFGLVAVQLARVQHREFGSWAWERWLRSQWRRLTRRTATQTVHVKAGVATATAGTAGIGKRRALVGSVQDQLAALADNLADFERQTGERFEQQTARMGELASEVAVVRSDLQREQDEREGEPREQLRESMALQWWGAGLFVVGAILAGWANAAC
jgi:hypothetical protein